MRLKLGWEQKYPGIDGTLGAHRRRNSTKVTTFGSNIFAVSNVVTTLDSVVVLGRGCLVKFTPGSRKTTE